MNQYLVQIHSDENVFAVSQLVSEAGKPFSLGTGRIYVDRSQPNPDSRLLAAIKTMMSKPYEGANRWI